MPEQTPAAAFISSEQGAEELAVSVEHIRAPVPQREFEAIQIGGRPQGRVERTKLKEYIARPYMSTAVWVVQHQAAVSGQGEPREDGA